MPAEMALTPHRLLPAEYSREVRNLVEEDEEFWVDQRSRVLGSYEVGHPSELLPPDWRSMGLSCLIDGPLSSAGNLRSHLTLYDTVVLAMPVAQQVDEVCRELGASPDEIVELMTIGRLRMLLPQPIERYRSGWLNLAVESAPNAVLPSRRFAAAVVVDVRRRYPFLYAPLEARELRELVALCRAAEGAETFPQELRAWFRCLMAELGDLAYFAPHFLHRSGAMRTSHLGIAPILSRFVKATQGVDRILEIDHAASVVEWAGALGAHVVPYQSHGYDESNAVKLVAALHSPLEPDRVPVAESSARQVVDELLGLDNDIPIVGFAKQFQSGDVRRLRQLAASVARRNVDEEFLRDAIERFNDDVRQYERRPERLRTFNLLAPVLGAVATAASPATGPLHYGAAIGVGVALSVTLARLAEPTPKGRILGSLWDFTNGLLSGKSADAVLVSRLRRQLKTLQ